LEESLPFCICIWIIYWDADAFFYWCCHCGVVLVAGECRQNMKLHGGAKAGSGARAWNAKPSDAFDAGSSRPHSLTFFSH